MKNSIFKSGTLVRLVSGVTLVSDDRQLTVVGNDSVGSVICEWPHEGHTLQAYFAPAVLTLADDDSLTIQS
jgi:hypothetical protein